MKKKSTLKVLLLFLLLATSMLSYPQQWTQTKGPGGGSVIDMLERNNTILAATLGGIFRSTDNGENWSRSVTGMPEAGFMTCLAQSPNYLYAAGWSEGLFRSSDDGATWTEVPINVSNVFILSLFCVGEDIYIGCEGAGVVRSTDGGANFALVNAGYPGSANVVDFALVGNYLFTGLAGNGGSVGIYRTSLNAINWTQKYVGGIGDIAIKGTDLYITAASPNGAGVFKSSDFGGMIEVYQGDLYTAKDGVGLYKSTNDGASWSPSNNGLKPLTAFSFLAGANGFFVGFERGVARTNNNGTSWQLKCKGLTNTSITSLYPDGTRLYATARTIDSGSSDGVFYTDDNGENWVPMDQGLLPNPQGKCLVKSGGNIILGTINYGIFIWQPSDNAFVKPPGIPVTAMVNTLLSSGQYVLAGISGEGEMYRSTDYGLTWTQSNTGFNINQSDQVYSLYEKDGVIYAGAFNGLYKSTDYGLTWSNSSAGIYPGADIVGITSLANDLYAVDDHNLGIYKSTNNGASWFTVNNGIPPIIQFHTIFANNGTLYAGSDLGVYKSTDGGGSWEEFNDNLLSKRSIMSFAAQGGYLYLGTDQTAVWKQGSALSVSENAIANAAIIPNPSNGRFNIVSAQAMAIDEVTIYNMLGQEVYHSVEIPQNEIDMSDKPSGIYLVKIRLGKTFVNQRVVINTHD
jgi:photosystem II stability/assembly factor-like uncharacterized protein